MGASGRARAGTIYVIPGVPRLPNFSTVRRPGRCADGHVVTVQEGRGGQLRVFEPMVYLYRPSCTIWAIWDAQNRSHTRPLGRADQIIGFIVELETVTAHEHERGAGEAHTRHTGTRPYRYE